MPAKDLYKNDWLSLKEMDGYIYSHESRSNGKIVAILVVDSEKHPGEVLGRYEDCPPHEDGITLTSITGGVEDDDVEGTAVMELKEEAGYVADETELIPLGTVRPTKSTDTTVYLFGIDVKGKEQGEAEGDGSEGEKGAYTDWVTEKEAVDCKDPLVATMIARWANAKGDN